MLEGHHSINCKACPELYCSTTSVEWWEMWKYKKILLLCEYSIEFFLKSFPKKIWGYSFEITKTWNCFSYSRDNSCSDNLVAIQSIQNLKFSSHENLVKCNFFGNFYLSQSNFSNIGLGWAKFEINVFYNFKLQITLLETVFILSVILLKFQGLF